MGSEMCIRDRSNTKDKDYFCIEGTHLIEEMLKSGSHPSKILTTEKWLDKNENLYQKIDKSLIIVVSEEVLASAVSTKNPDGVAALVEISSIPNFDFNNIKMTLFLSLIGFKTLGIWGTFLEQL